MARIEARLVSAPNQRGKSAFHQDHLTHGGRVAVGRGGAKLKNGPDTLTAGTEQELGLVRQVLERKAKVAAGAERQMLGLVSKEWTLGSSRLPAACARAADDAQPRFITSS